MAPAFGRITHAFGVMLAFLVGRVLRVRRAHVVQSLIRAHITPADAIASAMYRSLGQGLVELLWLGLRPRLRIEELVQIGPEIRALLAPGRGVVIATAHTGNWDLLACATARQVPLTVVTKRLAIGWIDKIWQSLRARQGVRLVSEGRAARALRGALAAGEAVAMLVDQAPERRRGVVVAPFLNQRAEIDLAPAWVAMRARVPLALVVAERSSGGAHRAVLLAKFEPPVRSSRAWAERTMRELTGALERHIRNRPEQWLWMHRRWKRTPVTL
jgi:KDO2-lipid IV(A) lauroyltransferase